MPLRYIKIHKVSLTAAVTGLAAVLLTGFVTFRPNRIAEGKAVYFIQTQSDLHVAVMTLWAVLIVLSLLRIPDRWHSIIASVISSVLIIFMIVTAGQHAILTAEKAGSIARISLGPAFWTSLFTLIVILTEAWRKSGDRKGVPALLAAITGLFVIWLLTTGRLDMLSIMHEFANRRERFFEELLTHMLLACSSVFFALAVGIPLGLLAHRNKRFYNPTFFTLNTLQTIPSLALFGILIPLLAAITMKFPFLTEMGIRGIGAAPAIIALTIYSLLPITRNTYTGFETVDPAAIEAGTGMGMTRSQLLFSVEIPIASPIILNGVRVALVQAIGLTAVAALIGAGGLGVFIFQGLGQAANDLILIGAIPTILIAVIVDSMMSGMVHALRPKGLG